MSETIKTYLEEFKKHYRYSPTQLGKIERIENYIIKLETKNKEAIEYIKENICDIDFMKKEYGNHFIDYDIETTFKDIENLLNILGGDPIE